MRNLLVLIIVIFSFCQISFSQNISFFNINTSSFKDNEKLMSNLNEIIGLAEDINVSLKPFQTSDDKLGFKHEKYRFEYYGIPFEFSAIIFHKKDNFINSINGEYFEGLNDLEKQPLIASNTALEKALNHINAEHYSWEDNSGQKPEGSLVYIANYMNKEDKKIHLAYKYEITATKPFTSDIIYVSALNGEILLVDALLKNANGTADTRYSGTQTISTELHTNNQYRLRDNTRGNGIETYNTTLGTDFFDNDNNWSASEYNNSNKDNAALDAHWGAMKTYDYFNNIHDRSSFDGNGATIKCLVHVGNGWDNAQWVGDQSFMRFGDGTSFDALVSLDILAHEFGHGLDQYTSNLTYASESGALDESFADIWGACVENFVDPNRDIWLIGEQIGNPLRSMSNPNNMNDPDTYLGSNWASTANPSQFNDWGGVHTNSGVPNFWFYLLSIGGNGTNDNSDYYDVYGISIAKSEQIAFRALTVYFTSNTNFEQARNLSIQAAIDIYGECSQEVVSTTNAWHAVGVGSHFQKDFNLLISNVINSNISEVYVAENNITASDVINSNSNISFLAGNSISLKPGFHAKSGTEFLAKIQNCEGLEFGNFNKKSNWEDYSLKSIETIKTENNEVLIYPNPSNSIVNIEITDNENTKLNLYATSGQKIISKNFRSNKITIEIGHLPNGLYLLEIESNNIPKYFKIIKE